MVYQQDEAAKHVDSYVILLLYYQSQFCLRLPNIWDSSGSDGPKARTWVAPLWHLWNEKGEAQGGWGTQKQWFSSDSALVTRGDFERFSSFSERFQEKTTHSRMLFENAPGKASQMSSIEMTKVGWRFQCWKGGLWFAIGGDRYMDHIKNINTFLNGFHVRFPVIQFFPCVLPSVEGGTPAARRRGARGARAEACQEAAVVFLGCGHDQQLVGSSGAEEVFEAFQKECHNKWVEGWEGSGKRRQTLHFFSPKERNVFWQAEDGFLPKF